MIVTGCEENPLQSDDTISSDEEALRKIIDEDEELESFEPNYNEDDAMDLAKVSAAIYPVRVGQKMRPTDREITIGIDGDSALAEIKTTFEGILFIAGNYDEPDSNQNSTEVDTVIEKEFSTTITRIVEFEKFANTDFPRLNWRIKKASLPQGGTADNNIKITNMIVYKPDGDTLNISSPNEYFLARGEGAPRHQVPYFNPMEEITVQIEVETIYPDTNFATITYGGHINHRKDRAKKVLELVSSVQDGSVYKQVYQGTYKMHTRNGWKHAVINAMPRQVINDDSTPVETDTWGIPYYVK